MVKFLKEKLEDAGCGIGSNFIQATNCEQVAAGGFARGHGVITFEIANSSENPNSLLLIGYVFL